MKFFLENAIFINRAPFDDLRINFCENEIAVLSGTNGRGKTTFLSHLVDSFYEIARPNFPQEFEGRESKYYRISSPIFNMERTLPSIVYFRFNVGGDKIDYVDIQGGIDENQYNSSILFADRIPFSELTNELQLTSRVKKLSAKLDKNLVEKVFENNLLTYFPAYRYESPGYLNDVYRVELAFKKHSGYVGKLTNPIEVSSGLNQLVNWVMDLVLDLRIVEDRSAGLKIANLSTIISNTLVSKSFTDIGFGVGLRGLGGTRLQVTGIKNGQRVNVYPSIFNLSSGELSVFCLFGELLRQIDNIKKDATLADISGIVLIDEVDKHLHIRLQNEVLPRLIQLFPNVQFILSSHSPFFSMGLADHAQSRAKIIDLDNFGISNDPSTNDLYKEVYCMMVKENDRFKEKYEALTIKNQNTASPLIITEGKTDWKYFLTALRYFHGRQEFKEINSGFFLKFGSVTDQESHVCGTDTVLEMGDSDLEKYLSALVLTREKDSSSSIQKRIGIFDSDNSSIKVVTETKNRYGVYSLKIVPDGVSTEFLFSDAEMKSLLDGRRLYVGDEFSSKTKKLLSDKSISLGGNNSNLNKAGKKVIVDQDVFDQNEVDVALSKERFAQAVFDEKIFISDSSWENFRHIFEKLLEIIKL